MSNFQAGAKEVDDVMLRQHGVPRLQQESILLQIVEAGADGGAHQLASPAAALNIELLDKVRTGPLVYRSATPLVL